QPLESLGPLEPPPPEEVMPPMSPAAPVVSPASAASAAAAGPAQPAPSTAPTSTMSPAAVPATTPSPSTMLRIPLQLFAPAEAEAAEEDSLATKIFALGAALKRVVVDENNATAYVHSVQGLLTLTAQRESAEGGLDQKYRQNYLVVVK